MEASTGLKRRKPWPTGQLHFLDRRIFECIVKHIQCRYARMALALTCKQCYGAIYTEELREWWFAVRGVPHDGFQTKCGDEAFTGPMADAFRSLLADPDVDAHTAYDHALFCNRYPEYGSDPEGYVASIPLYARRTCPNITVFDPDVHYRNCLRYEISFNVKIHELCCMLKDGPILGDAFHLLTCGDSACNNQERASLRTFCPENWQVLVDWTRRQVMLCLMMKRKMGNVT